MRIQDLVVRPHPGGNRIDLSWLQVEPAGFRGVRVVRREGAFPLSPEPASDHEGVVVADTNPTSAMTGVRQHADGRYVATDSGLKGETVYYYMLFPYSGDPPTYTRDRRNRAATLATAPYDFAAQMADLLPALYHRLDAAQLRRFLEIPGSQLDLLYSFARASRRLHDVEHVDSRLLPLLAQWIGWRIDHRLEADRQRDEIRHAPFLYGSIGLGPTLDATVERLVGWESRTKEFLHNVFRSNQPERLNLWLRERDANGRWTTPVAPLSLDFAYEGRLAAVRDQRQDLWLFYHTQRKGRWGIWFKALDKERGWGPSAPLTNRPLIEKHPTAAMQGAKLFVFWNGYSESSRRWQVYFRTYANGRWTAIAPLGALAPFASDDIERRQPWAVTDAAGMMWLFWLEAKPGRWELKYNGFDGASWKLSAPATFPLDAGADPHVDSAPFVVFNPADPQQPLWVFWARTEPIGGPGPRRWRIVYRVKATLNPGAMDWSPIRALPPGPPGSQDREPAALVGPDGEVEVFWSADRSGSWSIWRATINRRTHAWTPPTMQIESPYSQRDPLPVSRANGVTLLYRANESVKYKATIYGATETTDQRYAGSTTLDVRNAAKRALWNTFDDFQAFTSDVGPAGQRTHAGPYSREAVGLFVTPDTDDEAEIQGKRNLLQHALPEFLPAQVRTLLRTDA